MTAILHQNNFATNLTTNTSAGNTTTPLNSIPTIDAPFYIAFDATNVNGKYEVVQITSKTATNVNHAALTYDHTTAEEVRMVVPATELDDYATLVNNLGDGDANIGMARQAIMNGNFNVWQRGTSFTPSNGTVQRVADRFNDYVYDDGGTLPTLSVSRQTLTSGDIPSAYYFLRFTTNGAGVSLGNNSSGQIFTQIEHGVRHLCGSGKKVTVSFYARSDIANKKIAVILRQIYGTGGAPSSEEILKPDETITLTSTWTKYTKIFTTNTLSGKTFGTNNDDNLLMGFMLQWGSTAGGSYIQTGIPAETFVGSGNIDIAQVQLCAGDAALPFQPKSYEEELRACQRYYEKSFNYTVAPAQNTGDLLGAAYAFSYTTAAASKYIPFKVTKRITPTTVTTYNTGAANANWRDVTAGSDVAVSVSQTSQFGMRFSHGAPTVSHDLFIHWSADAEL